MRVVRSLICALAVCVGCATESAALDGSATDASGPGDGGGTSDGPRSDVADAPLSEAGPGGPNSVPLSAGDQALDVDCVVVGGEGSRGVQLANKGTQALGPLVVRLGGDGGSMLALDMDTCSGTSLPAGQSCSLVLLWHPLAPGTVTASLDVYAPPAGLAHFPVRASSRMVELVKVVPQTFDFGLVKAGTTSAPTSFRVSNMTNVPAKAPRPLLHTGESFQLGVDGCSGQILAPAASCTVGVRFAPAVMGPASDILVFQAGSACESDGSASLSGAGVP
jgi:hypothetical protein